LNFHLSIAKNRVSKAALLTANPQLDTNQFGELSTLYDEVEAIESRAIRETEVNFAAGGEEPLRLRLYASFFREGIFFTYVPVGEEDQSIMTLLSRRDLVIKDLLKSRKPYMTPLAVLVADLQDSVKICAELPPEEYFDLINQIWGTMEPIFRQFYATHGKHVGDGMVYYFFPQPDCNYIFNAIQCAYQMKEAMKAINQEWRVKKNWTNELLLNTGLDEGQEWFGAYQTPTHLEFTVLGDTINRAARLSDFARQSSIWVTKNLIATLVGEDREKITYGIRRESADGQEILVPSTFGRVSNLIDLTDPRNLKLSDIGVLPVTEIIDMTE
jgi:adenylate cyclase